MDSYVFELEKQNEALKQMLSHCQRKVDNIANKVWKWYDVKIVDYGSMTNFFTETCLEEVVFKIVHPMVEILDADINGKFISVKCFSGALLVWEHKLIHRKATDFFGKEKQDWYATFDTGICPNYSHKSFKTYADYVADVDRYAARLKERRERLHHRA